MSRHTNGRGGGGSPRPAKGYSRLKNSSESKPSFSKNQRRNRPLTKYERLFGKLTPRDQRRLNEAVIWGVNRLTNLNGEGPVGSKLFLESRAIQLVTEFPKTGWQVASKRYRDAVRGWAKRHGMPDLAPRVPDPVNSHGFFQQKQGQKTPIPGVEDSCDGVRAGAA